MVIFKTLTLFRGIHLNISGGKNAPSKIYLEEISGDVEVVFNKA